MISINNLTKRYNNNTVLSIDELEIPTGQSFGLVGNNGAGKTTLLRLMLDLIRTSSGEINIKAQNVAQHEDWKSYTGSFIDEKFLISYLKPEEYFNFLGKLHDLNEKDIQLHLEQFKSLFNDEILGKGKYIRDLSKGNKKKLGISAALLASPELVILDEPFENLDPTSQIRLKEIINHQNDNNTTFVISSHDLNHVTELCDRIVILDKGEVVKDLKVTDSTLDELNHYFTSNV